MCDHLDIHGRHAGLAGALAIDAMLSHQHQRVGQKIERNGQPPALEAHPEFVFFEGIFAVVIDRHVPSVCNVTALMTYQREFRALAVRTPEADAERANRMGSRERKATRLFRLRKGLSIRKYDKLAVA